MINKLLYIHYLNGDKSIIPVSSILFFNFQFHKEGEYVLIHLKSANENVIKVCCINEISYYHLLPDLLKEDGIYDEFTLTEVNLDDN